MPDDKCPTADLDFDNLRAVALAATPGPWHWDDEARVDRFGTFLRFILRAADRLLPAVIITGFERFGKYPKESDRKHIATFNPPVVLRLLDLAQREYERQGK